MIITFSDIVREIQLYPEKHQALELFFQYALKTLSLAERWRLENMEILMYKTDIVNDINMVGRPSILKITFVDKAFVNKSIHEIPYIYTYDAIKKVGSISENKNGTGEFIYRIGIYNDI